MHTIIFIALFLLFLGLGSLFCFTKNIKLFLAWTVLLPLTPIITSLHSKFQISVYFGFVAFPLLQFALNSSIKLKIPRGVIYLTIYLSLFVMFFSFYSFIFNKSSLSLINVLKDLKPILILGIGYIFFYIMKNYRLNWTGKFSKKLLKINFFVTILFFLLLNKSNFFSVFINDPFYRLNDTRYLTMGTFFVIFYFIAKLSQKEKFQKMEFIYVIVPVFLSGNRTFFIVISLIYILDLILSIDNFIQFLKRVTLFFTAGIVLVLGILNFNSELRERILTIFNLDLVIVQLREFRFAPFITQLESFSLMNYIFGKGIGETFFIPWFVWRKNIDNYNINMDNIYFTLYVKYGVFSIVLLIILHNIIIKTETNKRFKTLVLVYFLIMGFTTAFMYQNNFLFLILMLACFGFENYSKSETSSIS